MISNRLAAAATAVFVLGAASFDAAAQAQRNDGYATSPAGQIWKSPFGGCWRTGYWTPALANSECDPDLAPKPAAAPMAPRAAPAPKPAPAPAPMAKPAPKPAPAFVVTIAPFDFSRSTLTPQIRARLDKEVIERMNRQFSAITLVHVDAHTDRLGSHQYNQKLSEKRAGAVAAYLISRGVDRSKVETLGSGKINPVKSCPDQKDRKALAACLAPNRRVIIEVKGKPR